MIDITTEKRDEVAIVRIKGSVDATNADMLATELTTPIEQGIVKIVMDCKDLQYISSAGLRAILGALKRLKALAGELVVASIQQDVERVLQITGFTKLLGTAEDVDGAIVSLSQPADVR